MPSLEVFADVACPFTHVGLRRLVERRAEFGRDDVVLWVRAWPLELVNGVALDPHFVAEEVVDIREQVAPSLFAGFDEAAFPSTSLPAMNLAAAAYRKSPTVGEAVSLTLRAMLFEQGLDISDTDILAGVADEFRVHVTAADVATVVADLAEGRERGVLGSPHFFTPDGGIFCPSLEVRRDREDQLHLRVDNDKFERFAASCFA